MKDNFITIDCPVCGSNRFKTILTITPEEFLNTRRKAYYKLDTLGIEMDTKFYIKRCQKCSFVFVNPRFSDKVYNSAYNEAKEGQYIEKSWKEGDSDIAKLYNTHSKYDASQTLLDTIIYFKNRFEKAKNDKVKPIRLLDYGCGFGHILDLCKTFGIVATGVEIDENRLKYCRNKGLDVCRPEELPKNDMYDIVISWSVVEHVNDLNAYFRFISERLTKGGIFMFNGVSSGIILLERLRKNYKWVIPIEHINYFTLKSLKYMFTKHGFSFAQQPKMVQIIDSGTKIFHPFIKMFINGFYPSGVFKIVLVKN